MSQSIVVVDAFTDRPYSGNPAAVCLLEAPAAEAWMRLVAREMNLSETAFLHAEADGFHLRWFTPLAEVNLCGHATLAAAHVLWQSGRLPPGATARFHTRGGLLTARREGDLIILDFPARPAEPCATPSGLERALGAPAVHCGRSADDFLVEVRDEATVRALSPDLAALARLPVRGVIVTALPADRAGVGDPRAPRAPAPDFVSRFFAPAVGVDEDPVTGSAHCSLGPFWGERLGKRDVVGHQLSARGGVVGVRLRGDRVELRGQAVTTLRGELVT